MAYSRDGLALALVIACASLLVVLTGGEPAFAQQCGGGGNKDYYFGGQLMLDDGDDTRPLPGVQIKIVRQGSPFKGIQSPDVVTDANGEFQVHCKFLRDRNGAAAPGGKKVRFEIRGRFRGPELRVRKGGWFKNNWFLVGRERGCNRDNKPLLPGVGACKDFRHNNVNKTWDTDSRAGQHASLWLFYHDLMDRLDQHNVGLTFDRFGVTQGKRKLTVTYPDRNIGNWFRQNILNQNARSFYLINIHLAQGDWNATETLIHEAIHRWDVGHTRGHAALVCLFDAHHQSPDNWRSSRCSGYEEGLAEAVAQKLHQLHYGGGPPDTLTHWDLRTANPDGLDYQVENRDEAERTDIGWQNLFTLLWTEDEFGSFWSAGDADWCDPSDVRVYRVLQALKADAPRAAQWLVQGNADFEWLTDILRRHVSYFDREDAQFYQMLGDPALTADEIHNRTQHMDMCSGPGSGAFMDVGVMETDDEFHRVSFSEEFVDPVLITGPATHNGGDPGVVRVRDVLGTDADVQFQEWDYRESRHDDTNHITEQIPYLVVEEGRHRVADGRIWEAGTFQLDGTRNWESQSFEQSMPGQPILLLSVQSKNGRDPITIRARNVSEDGFEATLIEEEASSGGHVDEKIGYVAVYNEEGAPFYDADHRSIQTVDGSRDFRLWYNQNLDVNGMSPGGQVGQIFIDEETSADDETDHLDEGFHAVIFQLPNDQTAYFAQTVTNNGNDPFSIRWKY